MVDFHTHILPEMDDGSDSVETSLAMLEESALQGVDVICATPHFYADETDPDEFLARRAASFARLRAAAAGRAAYPRVVLGAEVLYFPGLSGAEQLRRLCLEGTRYLLIEPPMLPWSEAMLDEIEACSETLGCVPVVAHVDRYMRVLDDDSLLDRLRGRRVLIQMNAAFFLHRRSREFALECLRDDRFHFLGSDCHDLRGRAPNLGDAERIAVGAGLAGHWAAFHERMTLALQA